MSDHKRLYIITGKGGVGKTTIALALTQHLNALGVNARYLNFTTSNFAKAKEIPQEILLAQKTQTPHTALNLLEAAQDYVGKKMKSHTIGKWVVKTPFFKSLMSMIPGFNYLIYLGKTLEMLKNDPQLVLVLDSPSSGHALTMLEATKNFGEIFQSGLLFEDTQKMTELMRSPGFVKINALSLPISMAVNEAMELQGLIQSIEPLETEVYCNNSFLAIEGAQTMNLPPFLKAKLETEREIKNQHKDKIKAFVQHSLSNSDEQVIKDLAPSMDLLV